MTFINRIKRLFTGNQRANIPYKSNRAIEIKPNPENIAGDFYVVCDACIHCGAPEAEAPDLMEMNDEGCYFKKQPTTPEEIERAINAVAVSCISAVRYGGTNRDIINRLSDLGCVTECDFKE